VSIGCLGDAALPAHCPFGNVYGELPLTRYELQHSEGKGVFGVDLEEDTDHLSTPSPTPATDVLAQRQEVEEASSGNIQGLSTSIAGVVGGVACVVALAAAAVLVVYRRTKLQTATKSSALKPTVESSI
jgi:hypothetical protein